MNKKKSNMHMINMVVDFIHIGICIAIIVLAIIVFFSPMQKAQCYPVIFFLASVLNFTSAYARMKQSRHGKSRWSSGIGVFILGVLFLLLSIISGVSVWG